MAKGIIYIMSTVVPGLIKIGKTKKDQFDNRMRYLESNGYKNITGLKREFAICVKGYDDKEKLIHDIFSKSRIENTELFALDIDIVISLLSSFEGEKIFPLDKSKDEVFKEYIEDIKDKSYLHLLPNGEYFLERNIKGFGKTLGKAKVENGKFIVMKGSFCCDTTKGKVPSNRKNAIIKNNILMEDVVCNSPSAAGYIVLGCSNNG